jgi:UDP-glucose:(glucosyl)LPS alpha-1,2-glucosyltransferase
VVPSRWPEPFGLTALEAMANGTALICSPHGNLPELVRDAAVLTDPDDAGALAAAITALARDEPRRAALGAAGLARARAFDIRFGVAARDRLRRDLLGS